MGYLRLIAGAALVLSAGAAVAERREGSVVHVTEADNGRTFRAEVGLEIRARIAQPKGTPLRWEVRNDPHFTLIEAPQSSTAYGTGMGKGRDFRSFRLRIIRPGRFQLAFGLLPPRAAYGTQPAQRIAMTVDAPYPDRNDGGWNPRPRPDWNDGDADGPDTIEPLNERDTDRRIDVPVRQEITIALPSNASTGYYWDVATIDNARLVGRIEEERSRGARIGAGGTSLVRLRVIRRGPAEVKLYYLPPGGGNSRRTLVYRFRGI